MAQAMNEFAKENSVCGKFQKHGTHQNQRCNGMCMVKFSSKHVSGRHPAPSKNVETELCDYLKDLARHGFPLRLMEVRAVVYQFAIKHGYLGSGLAKTMTAGRFWFKCFRAVF